MSLVRWDPFAEIDTMFSRLVPRGRMPRLAAESDSGITMEWSPSANISETDTEYLIRAELPGTRKEDVKVTFADGVITIEGERKQEKEVKEEKFHRTESFYGSFSRSFSLPDNINAETIRCESKDGVLTVRIPKAEQRKPKQIQVQ